MSKDSQGDSSNLESNTAQVSEQMEGVRTEIDEDRADVLKGLRMEMKATGQEFSMSSLSNESSSKFELVDNSDVETGRPGERYEPKDEEGQEEPKTPTEWLKQVKAGHSDESWESEFKTEVTRLKPAEDHALGQALKDMTRERAIEILGEKVEEHGALGAKDIAELFAKEKSPEVRAAYAVAIQNFKEFANKGNSLMNDWGDWQIQPKDIKALK